MPADKVFPTDSRVQMLICDTARQEIGGKITLLGFFGGEDIRIESGGFPAQFPLAFVFVLKDGVGDFKSEIELIGGDGKSIFRGRFRT